MRATIIIFVGGGVGAALRYLGNIAAARFIGIDFPWGTFLINIAGSFAMGLLVGLFAVLVDAPWKAEARLFLATGLLGGFTTFSAFSLDAILLWERGAYGAAAAYVFGSVGLSILALAMGLFIARSLA
jgi:CrcB protein